MRAALLVMVMSACLWAPSFAHATTLHRGINFTAWWHDTYASSAADASLSQAAADGNGSVAIVVTWYMDSRTASTVAPDASRTPTDQALSHSIRYARSLGLEVALKPHVDVRDGTWRGAIEPHDRGAWWASYRRMIEHYAQLAAANDVGLLEIGTELVTMTVPGDEQPWRLLISAVRAQFARTLTYAANQLHEAEQVGFWDALDLVGVDAYMPLADPSDPSPSVGQLVDAWTRRGYVAALAELSRRHGRRVLLTEIGYRSGSEAAVRPWEWGAAQSSAPELQARLYDAAYRALARQPWFAGLFWWDWSARVEQPGPDDTGYSPYGKPAREVVRSWNQQLTKTDDDDGEDATDPQPAVQLTVRRRTVRGRVTPHDPRCAGTVMLQSRGGWRGARRPSRRRLTSRGRFRFAISGRHPMRVRATFTSGCQRGYSRWVTVHPPRSGRSSTSVGR